MAAPLDLLTLEAAATWYVRLNSMPPTEADQQAWRHWLAANMNHEAWLGFNAFDAKKPTGKDVIDFIKFRQLVAEGALFDEKWAEQVMAKPKG